MGDQALRLVDSWRTGQRCPADRRRRWRRRVSSVTTVGIHATAAAGGFGLAKYQLNAARRELTARAWPGLDPSTLNSGVVSTSEIPDDNEIREHAMLTRYSALPYHGIYHPAEAMSVVQWSARDYTYHGNGMNRASVGWAYDGLFNLKHEDELEVDGGREGLRHLITAALEQGCPLSKVECHGQHANKPFDPGGSVWRDVVLPVCAEFGLEVSHRVTGRGHDMPTVWAEEAA